MEPIEPLPHIVIDRVLKGKITMLCLISVYALVMNIQRMELQHQLT